MTVQAITALSPAQQRIIEHPLECPGVVDAGAGTGKTFTIVERVAALHASGACPANSILLLTFGRKAAAELRARIARRLGEQGPEGMTFHAFAWRILSTHFYDVGLSPDTTVIEDVDARVEFQSVFDAYLNDPLAGTSGFPLRQFNREEMREQLFALRQRLHEEGATIDGFRERALAAAERFARVRYRELREPYARPKPGREFRCVASVSDEEFAEEIVEEKQRVQAVAAIFERFDHRLAQRNALTYADILVRAEAALRNNAALREELRTRYRCCIVDEYQDTDLAQHRFLTALFGSGLERIMVVGDVLQSIYSFRGARPHNVAAFKQAKGAITYPLLENRRSFQEILDLAHHAVLAAHPDAQALAGERGSADEQIVNVSSLWVDADAPHGAYIPFDRARKLEASAVARQIVNVLNSGMTVTDSEGNCETIAPRHIAILSRTKTNVQPVTDALLTAGIPFRLVGGVGFYDTPEIRDAVAWLRLLADPLDAHAVARVLSSPAIGAPDAVLAAIAKPDDSDATSFARAVLIDAIEEHGDASADALAAAQRLRSILDDLAPFAVLPLVSALRAVIERTGMEQHYRASNDPRAPQARANLSKLEALARRFARDNPGAQPAEFAAFMDELERIDFDEREADVSDYDAVTLSTIHSAKGLEWPIVFVLSVWPDLRPKPRLFVDRDGALLYGESVKGRRPFHFVARKYGADEHGIVRRKDERDEEADNTEEQRLFYVAITRARDRLFLSGIRRRPSRQNPDGKPHQFLERVYQWMKSRAWECDAAIPVPRDVPSWQPAPLTKNGAARAAVEVAARSDVTVLGPLSYSKVADYEQCPRRATYRTMYRLPEVGGIQRRLRVRPHSQELEVEQLAPEDALLNSGDYGLVLHKALELWANAQRVGEVLPSADAVIARAASLLGQRLPSSQALTAAQALATVMRKLAAWKPLQVEAPFTLDFGTLDQPLLVFGYLDLLAQDGDGRQCLVDYKSGGARREHFGLQLALYRRAARLVYGIDIERCYVGRIEEATFVLEPVQPVSDDELRQRIMHARDGLLAQNTDPIAGAWCGACGYREAPCLDYQRSHKRA